MDRNRFRSVFFLFLLVSFFVTVGSVLFFTFGYRFNFDRGIFVYTGSITLKTNPRDISVFLDGKSVPSGMLNIINQSYHIAGIDPGEHLLRIEAAGFLPWEKKVSVQSGISTEFWNILLLRSEYPVQNITTGNFGKFFPSPDNKFLALVESTGALVSVSILNVDSGEREPVFSKDGYSFDYESENNIEWSEDNSKLIIPVRNTQNEGEIFLVERETGNSLQLGEITEIRDPRNARWHPDNNGTLFVLSKSTLFLVRPGTFENPEKTDPILISENVATYDLSDTSVFILNDKDSTVYRATLGDKELPDTKRITGPIETEGIMNAPVLTVYDEKRLTLRNQTDGKAFLWNDAGEVAPLVSPLGNGIRNMQFSDDGKKLLFSTDNEISVIFVRDWDVQPSRKTGEVIQIARFSSPITSVQWTPDYEHVLFSSTEGAVVAELDHRDHRQMKTFVSFPKSALTQMFSVGTDSQLFFLSRHGDGSSTISSIDFPENETFFGN